MKKKIKKILKSKIFVLLLIALLFGTAGVYAATYFPSVDVTYDNKESGLQSTDVQGAIDELYIKAKQVSSGVSSDVVENLGGTTNSGDGIYKDLYEKGRYIYKGGNPNNYITFNGEDAGWWILSIEPDGTIKIIKTNNIGNRAWSSNGRNSWNNSDLNSYLNETYYNSLNSTAKNQIVSHNFSIGAGYYNEDFPSDLTDLVNSENEQLWNGKIGLMTVSEYLRTNSNTNMCRRIDLINRYYRTCNSSNWMFSNIDLWTITASIPGTDGDCVFYIYNLGDINHSYYTYSPSTKKGIRPVLYLSSDITLKGSGTQSNPFTIE